MIGIDRYLSLDRYLSIDKPITSMFDWSPRQWECTQTTPTFRVLPLLRLVYSVRWLNF